MFNSKLLIISVLLLILSGCKSLSNTFITAVREHRQDTVLVNQSLINTFVTEKEKETRPEAIIAYDEIINNLKTVSHQAEILDQFIWSELTEDELASFLRSKWRVNP